jgi:hypothetical protein
MVTVSELVGSRNPRLFTSSPSVSTRGPEFIRWANAVGVTLLPWQEELAIRALAVDGNGAYVYRTVVVLVGRQSGKTTFCKVLALWKMLEDDAKLVVGAAQSLDISREAWMGAVDLALENGFVEDARGTVRRANGEQCLTLPGGARYRITATTAGAGRGLSVDLLVMDEARMQRDWSAWSALSKTTIARPNSQVWVISNAGDDQSVVLNTLREKALSGDDPRLGLFEWSADPALPLEDRTSWAQGCPGVGHTVPWDALEAAFGTDPPAVFRTEIRCERVASLDGAVDMAAWRSCMDTSVTLDGLRDRIALCVDVSTDGSHVTLMAAAVDDAGFVRVEPVDAWSTPYDASLALPGWLERIKPRVFGWFPGGPAGALGQDLRGGEEIKGIGVAEACMSFAEQVQALRVRHGGDPLLDAHVAAAEKYRVGDAWRFARPRLGGNVDAAYAAAGAVYLARHAMSLPVAAKAFVL